MRQKTTALLCLAILLIACTLSVPPATRVPADLSNPTLEPTFQSTNTAAPTNFPPATSTPQSSRTPSLAPSPRPTATRTLTPTRYPTPLSRVTEIAGQQCPFNLPVKIVAPGVDYGGYDWKPVIVPMADACVSRIKIAPNDEKTWYVGGQTALYITRDEGKTWERPLTGQVSAVEIDPNNPDRVYVSFQVASTLYESSDKGRNWRLLKKFDQNVMSLLVAGDGLIIVGPHWGSSPTANGVYISLDKGVSWQHAPFGTAHRGLIVWDVAQDPRDRTLYAGTEIYDHPKPYKPPTFRSRDNGKTWQEVTDILPWHVIGFQISPVDSTVYALTEGAGVYGSTDHGDRWMFLGNGPSISLAADPRQPERFFGGAVSSPAHQLGGGVFVSTDGGRTFNLVGLRGVTISSIGFSPNGSTLFAVAYSSGIYRVQVP